MTVITMAHAQKMTEIFLPPGEFFVGNAKHRIGTLLGSCVSITIWHPHAQIGAMSHFLLPTRGSAVTGELDGRYGDDALCLMLRELALTGVKLRQCEAKVFGGGDMFPAHSRRNEQTVGQKNGQAARAMLSAYCIPVVSGCLYGDGHRRIIFDVSNGHVWSRRAKAADATEGLKKSA